MDNWALLYSVIILGDGSFFWARCLVFMAAFLILATSALVRVVGMGFGLGGFGARFMSVMY